LVYVIAAYSITIGVLALYGALLQHRMRMGTSAIAAASKPAVRSGADPRRGFNLGAALLPPFWLWAHGMRLPAVLIGILWCAIGPLYQRELWLPLVFVATIPAAAGLALGFVGNRVAVAQLGLPSLAARSASQLPWTLVGIVLYVFVLPWAFFLISG